MSICFVCGAHDQCADCIRLTRPVGVEEPTLFDEADDQDDEDQEGE